MFYPLNSTPCLGLEVALPFRWVLVRTVPRREHVAFANVTRQGAIPYLPSFYDRGVVRVLFPSYLFVQTDQINVSWLDNTIGVAKRVRVGFDEAIVPQDAIDELKSRESLDGLIRLAPPPDLLPGQRVELTEGPFTGFLGLYEGMTAEERCSVLVSIFGRQTRMTCDRASLRAA